MINSLEQQIKDYWNRQPCNIKHGKSEPGTPAFFHEVSQRRYLVEPHITQFAEFSNWRHQRVLEIGCGIGTDAEEFARFGAHYVGIDYSDQSVKMAKKRFAVLGLAGEFFNIDASSTADIVALGQFDMVYSFGVIHHFPNIQGIIKNVHQLLKPGGEFRFMVYAKHSWKYAMIQQGLDQFEAQADCPYAEVFTAQDIHQLLDWGFDVMSIEQDHCFMYNVDAYKQGLYELEPWFEAMSEQHRSAIKKHLGWHLLIKARRKS